MIHSMELTIQSILVRRDLPVTPEAVWHAFTNAEALASWYHPVGLATPRESVVVEPEVGGRWSATVVAPMDGSRHHFFGRYRRLEAPNVLEYSMHYAADDAIAEATEEGPSHTVIVVIERIDGGSRVTYLEFGLLPVGEAVHAQAGMEQYFESLRAFLIAAG